MNIKKTVIIVSLSLTSLAIAGGRHHAPPADPAGRDKLMAEHLQLTEEQQKQFRHVMQIKDKKIQSAMEKIHTETLADLSEFLTEDQLQMLKKNKEKRKELQKHAMQHQQMRHSAPPVMMD